MKLFPKIFGIGLVGIVIAAVICSIGVYFGMSLRRVQEDVGKYRMFRNELTAAKNAHLLWLRTIDEAIISAKPELKVGTDGKLCAFGKWYYSEGKKEVSTFPEEFQNQFNAIAPNHLTIHELGGELIEKWNPNDLKPAVELFTNKISPTASALLSELTALEDICRVQVDRINERSAWLLQNQSLPSLITLFVGIGIVFVYSYFTARSIVVPIHKMTDAAQELSQGNINIDIDFHSRNETGVLADAFREMTSSLKAKTETALEIAKGNLTPWVPLKSDNDVLGFALIKMRYSFYDSINQLQELAQTVYEESNILSESNKVLFDNTTNTTNQLKSITESIRSLNAQTEQNAEKAKSAENLTQAAKGSADQGREKMERMVQSMEAITKSSDKIKNIIRVIDDIAFQTNLLALNAAVEAARAGQHGKGFAVVAEEVRNLASRSANAAKETEELIEESIHQVGTGSGVAGETSESLDTITEQVEQVSQIVTAISDESGQQKQQLGGVTDRVNQVYTMADANLQSVTNALDTVVSITKTAEGLDTITKHFRSNPGGKVTVPPNPGFVPPHGTRYNER